MGAYSALLEQLTHGLVAGFAAAPVVWTLAVLVALLALLILALRPRRKPPPPSPRSDVDMIYTVSAATTRKAREISEFDAFARRIGAAADEMRLQLRRMRAGHHSQVKIYIDHSNFIRSWNDVVHRAARPLAHDVDWHALPAVLLEETADWLKNMYKAPSALVYRGMHVYGTLFEDEYYRLLEKMLSQDRPTTSRPLPPLRLRAETIANWRVENEAHKRELTREIRNVTGCTVVPIYRRTPKEEQLAKAHFMAGGIPIAPEKTLDMRLATDLIGDATFEVYDIALLVTEDSDFIPAVEFVQDMRHKHVIHVGFGSHTNELRSHCRYRIDLARGSLYRRMQRRASGG
jgi:uncharacterized LabA/DUF88 family protein